MTNLSAKTLLQGNQLFQEFRGSYIENYAAQTLSSNHFGLYYWTSEGKAELDFIVEFDGRVYPLEIKSGLSNKKKSLQSYIQKHHPVLAVKSSPLNLSINAHFLNCPLYLLEQLPTLINLGTC